MSLSDFLSPVDLNSLIPEDGFYTSHLGSKIVVYPTDFPDLDDNQFDVILVDGRDRVRCALQSIPKLKKNGIMLIHDFWNREKYHVLLDNNELDLIVDSNSYNKTTNNTLVALKKK